MKKLKLGENELEITIDEILERLGFEEIRETKAGNGWEIKPTDYSEMRTYKIQKNGKEYDLYIEYLGGTPHRVEIQEMHGFLIYNDPYHGENKRRAKLYANTTSGIKKAKEFLELLGY